MRILRFNVEKQRLKKDNTCDFSRLAPGTKGYLHAAFNFSKEWDDCKKAAIFFRDPDNAYYEPIIDEKCKIPEQVTEYKMWKMQVVGEKEGYRITTTTVEVMQI